MEGKKVYDLDKLITFRHNMHENPELGFQEYNTRESIKKFLVDAGVDPKCFRELAVTGLVVDLKGKAEPQGKDRCIAVRADMDGLSMCEENHHLPYRSKKAAAHMCGHDGHVTCALSFAMRFLDDAENIPSNKTARFLFQPSEEGPTSGAELMVKEGCLDGVDEVYGYHNWPTRKAGKLDVIPGPVMTSISVLKIDILGTMGHGSEPDKVKDCVKGAVKVYESINNYINEVRKQHPNFVGSLPVFQAGSRYNVFGEKAHLEGTIRSFDMELSKKVVKRIEELSRQVEKDGFRVEFNATEPRLPVTNTPAEAGHVLRVAQGFYGTENAGKGILPVLASEDFGHFTQSKPGAFFFLSSAKEDVSPMLHSNNFDFNDDLIESTGRFWLSLVRDRFELA